MSTKSFSLSVRTFLTTLLIFTFFSMATQSVMADNNRHGGHHESGHGNDNGHGSHNTHSNAQHNKDDPSNGQCDAFEHKANQLCKQAHKTKNNIDELKANGSTLEKLRAAEQKLEKQKLKFFNLTGLPVPGLTPACEIPELSTWLESSKMLGDIVEANTENNISEGGCSVSLPFTAAYREQFPCDRSPSVYFYNDGERYFIREAELNVPVFEGGNCPFGSGTVIQADMLQLQACAVALGCDIQ